MQNKLSHEKLYENLLNLKNTMQNLDNDSLKNVIFFNSHSFYCYLSKLPCGNNQTVSDVLSEIENCIPFALTDDSFSLFISSYEEDSENQMNTLRKGFLEGCKTDFLLLLLQTKEQFQWEHIILTCEQLRQKEFRI